MKTEALNQRALPVKYGDIFLIDFDGAKYSEQNGIRPAIVIQNDVGNAHSSTILVAPLTSKTKKYLPTHLEITPAESGLKEVSTALFEQVRVADKKRIIKKVGHIDNSLIENVKRCLTISFNMV